MPIGETRRTRGRDGWRKGLTPDQDVVDEIGRAVGVEQGSADELRTSEEILRDRDQRRWQLEWEGRRSRDRSN